MMGKERKGQKANIRNSKKRSAKHEDAPVTDMMDDEIDAFHKQRDDVPLNINDDIGASDEDDEHPVFDFKDVNDDEEDDEDEDIDDDTQLTGLAAKIVRQQTYLRAKVGGVEEEMDDDIEDKGEKRAVWGRRKSIYYNADNNDYELQSSDEELPAEEESEVLRLRKENAKSLSLEDFGIEDVSQDGSDGEPTLEEILVKGNAAPKASVVKEVHDDPVYVYEEVKKDLNALSKEEQMDVVYSSAPELVGLLSELNDAFEELENKVNPLLSKVRERGNTMKEGMRYMELKQLLLLVYCQSITFYLLLKSEGHPVRDHPVIARLVEVKNLLDRLKQLDKNLPSGIENILSKKDHTVLKSLSEEDVGPASDSLIYDVKHTVGNHESIAVPHQQIQKLKVDSSKDNEKKGKKRMHLSDHVSVQSMEMFKVRAALEEKLKQKGIFDSTALKVDKVQKRLRPLNGHLETMDDFDDDATDLGKGSFGISNEHANSRPSSKLSQLVTPRLNKIKIISGDDDLPKRDDIGERRRKHELRVLVGAGIGSGDEVGDGPDTLGSAEDHDMEEGGESESEDEFYREVKQQRALKIAAKSNMYARTPAIQSIPEEALVDGRRHITYQMEKNRGLTRNRKKLTKNPRKKYRLQHQKTVVRRKGQVRDIRKPSGPYSGEASGINADISRSIRFRY